MKSKTEQFLVFIAVLITQISFAQEKTVTGSVTDNLGLPLPGVNIVEKGTNKGTQSNFDGKYTITTSKGAELIFSYLGFADKVITVGDNNTINIQFEEETAILDEVVVTGVATGTSKRKLGVSVNSVKAEDLQTPGSQSIDQALQGKIAGTIIQSTSGQPGQQQNIVLRAINSINGSQPMILIDGVEILTSSSSIGGANLSSRLSDIDFSTIDRVETISGAAAGTIYGAQGANGVINIITKKGNAGKPKVTIRTSSGLSQVIVNNNFRRASFHHYETNDQGLLIDLNGTPVIQRNNQSQYLAVDVEVVDVNGTQLGSQGINNTPYAEPIFDATDVLFKDAINLVHGVNVSGGSDKMTYLVSGNRTAQESVIIDGTYVKYDGRLNLSFDLSDKLKVNTRFDVINSTNDTGNSVIRSVFENLPHVDLRNAINSDGDLLVVPDATDPNSSNPFFATSIQTRQDEINRYIANLDIKYNPFDILSINLKYGYDSYSQNFIFFQENKSDHQQASSIGSNINGRINLLESREYFQNFLASLNLNLNFREKFDLNTSLTSQTTINFDWRDRNFTQSSLSGTDNPFGSFGDFNINQSSTKTFNGFFESPFRTYGFLVNQKFDFGSLLGFSAGFRTDFSNRFGAGFDATFPRGDAYFNIAELFESNTLTNLKIRGAYGKAGIQPPFGQNLLTLSGLTFGSEVGLAFPNIFNNKELKVETSREIEIGTDFTITPGRGNWFSSINGSFNYFDRNTEDVIFRSETPTSSGSGELFDNAYDITSDGVELSLDTAIYQGDNFFWNFGVRFSKSSAILAKIKTGLPLVVSDNFVLEQGQEIGTFSLFEVITSLDALDNDGNRIIPTANLDNFTVASSGYVVNKNTGNVVISPDKRTLGSSQPDFVMTFINDFSFSKTVSLSLQLDWFQGLDVYNGSKQVLYNNALHEDTAVPVTIEDPTGTLQTGAFVTYYTSIYNTGVPTSHFLEDGSFLRLRNVSVNFKLNNWFRLKGVDNIDFTLSGRNLLTFTNYTGLDPEASVSFGNTFQRGFDSFTHPNTKSYNLGLILTF
ncbi:SusC/RagA family TonB-linked outer membrane protein [Aquimarina sp. RZ0]|uniref:SusC/RagA family TonB-linked outer membrane protein n=1 Tax=Aquimarina sp. RZ0 TaxID=2607730 RepID=UPI0011F2AF00|nr:SusC/RagA family TonB-linked outer membrane protein [Aquimarina sp. RZ0]KAA1247100.1 SusC/RagA family TonB-linked outer membrane protein [Aquimarina sp. RZ0]